MYGHSYVFLLPSHFKMVAARLSLHHPDKAKKLSKQGKVIRMQLVYWRDIFAIPICFDL